MTAVGWQRRVSFRRPTLSTPRGREGGEVFLDSGRLAAQGLFQEADTKRRVSFRRPTHLGGKRGNEKATGRQEHDHSGIIKRQ